MTESERQVLKEVLDPSLTPAMMSREQLAGFIKASQKLSLAEQTDWAPTEKQAEHLAKPVDLNNKLCAACVINTLGVPGVGPDVQYALMWPLQKFSEAEVAAEAFKLTSRVLVALLTQLPLALTSQILQEQVDRLTLND